MNQIRFRDYLIGHPQLAQEYAHLKQELAQRFPQDREAYTEGKTPFVGRILQLAISEAAAQVNE